MPEGDGGDPWRSAVTLGDILVKQGLLSRAKLDLALSGGQVQAGQLATYLVEHHILTFDQVALGLADQFGVPPALEADFARSDATLRKRLVVHQAVELQAIPLFSTAIRRVAVAMANPCNRGALDRLAFILGATVDPMVTSEGALARQFELLYKVRRKAAKPPAQPPPLPVPQKVASRAVLGDPWDIRPALRSHRRLLRDKPFDLPMAPSGDATPPVRLAPLDPASSRQEAATPIAVMEDALCFTPTPATFLAPGRPCDPPMPFRVFARHPLTPVVVPITSASAQLAVDQIRFATDQQDLSDSLFSFMRNCFAVGAMFGVSGATALGRFGFSGGLVRPDVESLRVSLSLPSCFRIARSRRSTFRGQPPPDGMAVQGPLWAALATAPPTEVMVAPVIVDGVVTLLLYAQSEPGGHIGSLAAGKMEQVCEALSSSLLRLAV
jgi:hypothetical protein